LNEPSNPLVKAGQPLAIIVHPFLLPNPSSFGLLPPYRLWLVAKLRRYLRSVDIGFTHFAMQGKTVPDNHLGRYYWFS
jgi:hypothetical protein